MLHRSSLILSHLFAAIIVHLLTENGMNRLKRLELRKILSRNDELYISRMFKSRWQPLPAYIGIAGCLFVIIWSGVPAIWILGSRSATGGKEVSPGARTLKSNTGLAFDILGAWIGVSGPRQDIHIRAATDTTGSP